MSNVVHGKHPGYNWLDIEKHCAPIDPSVWIVGLTTHKKVEPCHYLAFGDFKDRWGRGNMTLMLTHWRPMTKEDTIKYKHLMVG